MTDEKLRSWLWTYIEQLVIDTNNTVIKNSENSNSVNAAEQNVNFFFWETKIEDINGWGKVTSSI